MINFGTASDKIWNKRVWRLGLIILGLWLAGCSNIVQIVPLQTPTPPVPASPPSPTPLPPPVGNHIPTQIIIPVIDLEAPVVEMGWRVVKSGEPPVTEWEMPENEAGWHRNSARPGEDNNVVISGHNESTGGHVFARLDELQLGDEIRLRDSQNELFTYQVVEKNIVRTFAISTEADEYLRTVTQATMEEQLTLITCWPRWSNTHRLVIRALPLISHREPLKPETSSTSP